MSAAHNCAERINESLAEHNSMLEPVIAFGPRTMTDFFQIATIRKNGTARKKAPALFASYCPFCGISLALDAGSAA